MCKLLFRFTTRAWWNIEQKVGSLGALMERMGSDDKPLDAMTLPLLALYSGQRGKGNYKYLFYIYYPLHLFLCGLLRVLLWGAAFVTATANF